MKILVKEWFNHMNPPSNEKRSRFRELAKQGKVETGRQFEAHRQQLEFDFERRPARCAWKPGTSRQS